MYDKYFDAAVLSRRGLTDRIAEFEIGAADGTPLPMAEAGSHIELRFGGEDGKMTGIERLLLRMERDEFDLIAVGRSLLADPNWANKIRNGKLGDLRPFEVAQLAKLD